jgi:hypothetical protein
VANGLLENRIRTIRRNRQRPFGHTFHDDAVGFVGSRESINTSTVLTGCDDCVNLAGPDGAEGLFGFIEAFLQVAKAPAQVFRCLRSHHSELIKVQSQCLLHPLNLKGGQHPFSSNGIDGVTKPYEEGLEVVLAGILNRARFQKYVIDQ